MTTWRILLYEKLEQNNESVNDIEANTMTDEAMDEDFDDGFGGEEGCAFTVWTKNYVYFHSCYDDSEWVSSVPRNPNGEATCHIGGG